MQIKVKNSTETISPTKIICLGRNYRKHAEELGNVVPDKPIIFLKPPSSLIVEGEKIILPSQSQNVHHEVELGVVIGKAGRNIPRAKAEVLAKRLGVNGETRQVSNSRFMIFGIAEIVEYISSYMTLEVGDIIATGTPEGVGPIRKGDVITAEIEGIGKVRFEVG